jgi:diketogulonate reductase-like aldo/keto reductase
MSSSIVVQGVPVPRFFYGTAWKEEDTAALVALALAAGFRAIDTANQRKHYFEAAVGEAWAASGIARAQLLLQTKFTQQRGQDHRLPYDAAATLTEQVQQSFASSLEHLRTDYIDSFVLHGPSIRFGLSDGDWEVWRAMEALKNEGKTRLLGVSNVSFEQLSALHRGAEVKPAFVQNRCFATSAWDADVRAYCRSNGIVYQGFSLLTANARVIQRPALLAMAERHGCTLPQLVFRFALQVGMIALTGTSSEQHMREDLACEDIELNQDELDVIERIAL